MRLRQGHQCNASDLSSQIVMIDGYNVLTTIEVALAGGVLLLGRDGCLRDMASMHGSFRRVSETVPALRLIGQTLAKIGVCDSTWLLDSPVSNSGRLKTTLEHTSTDHGWNWTVRLVANPDKMLIDSDQIVATADSVILDHCHGWFNLARRVVGDYLPGVRVVDLSN